MVSRFWVISMGSGGTGVGLQRLRYQPMAGSVLFLLFHRGCGECFRPSGVRFVDWTCMAGVKGGGQVLSGHSLSKRLE